jgi:site-specific DNA-methyltransferase (adenine-specific)
LLWAGKREARHAINYEVVNARDPASQIGSVWRMPPLPGREKRHGRHRTQKPLRLVRRALVACTQERSLVFDPFAGSGTTAVAKELGRSFVGAESERGFCELAAQRTGGAVRGNVLAGISASASVDGARRRDQIVP